MIGEFSMTLFETIKQYRRPVCLFVSLVTVLYSISPLIIIGAVPFPRGQLEAAPHPTTSSPLPTQTVSTTPNSSQAQSALR